MRVLQPDEIYPTIQIANYFTARNAVAWGPRKIADCELILVVSGHFRYERRDLAPVTVSAGEVLCIPPEVQHTFRLVSTEGVISCIHCELTPSGRWGAGEYRLQPAPQLVTSTGGDACLHTLFQQCAEVFSGYTPYRDALLQTMVREVWLRLAAYWETPARTPYSPRMAAMIAYLREHLHRPISRQELAEVFAVTPQHVNTLFRKELGISPTQFLHRERILRAYRHLQIDGMSVGEAAVKVGFQDVLYFSRIFKKVTGMRPSQVR